MLVSVELFHLPDLVRVIHGVQQNAFWSGPQHNDVFAIVHGDFGHAHASALAQRLK